MGNRLFKIATRLLISFCLIISIWAVPGCGDNKHPAYDEVIISGKTLKFGMTEKEITSLFGKANDRSEEYANKVVLTYKGFFSFLGFRVSSFSLTVFEDKNDADSKSVKNRGLSSILIDMPKATENVFAVRFEKAYGKYTKSDKNHLSGAHGTPSYSYNYYPEAAALSTLDKSIAEKIDTLYASLKYETSLFIPQLSDWVIAGSESSPGCTFYISGNKAAIYNRCVK